MDESSGGSPEGPQQGIELTVTVRSAPSPRKIQSWTGRLLAAADRPEAAVSLLFCGDQQMRGLNRSFRQIDRPTDVLSFPSNDERFLGDLAIDVPYAARQARKRGHGLDREIQILLTHGILHLLGHDHETDDGMMFKLQSGLVTRVFGPGPDGVPVDVEPIEVPVRERRQKKT